MNLNNRPLTLRPTTNATPRPTILASGTLLALGSTLLMSVSYAATSNETTLEGVTVTGKRNTVVTPAANPNADPQAPYKIDKSGNEKFTEPLINVSKTITVVGKEQLADTGTTALRDLMRTQPAITLGTGEGGNAEGDRFIIRGFEARSDIFVDGMRDPGVTTRETFAYEQVEIAKGASSTFAGRGTTGGAVNSITKKPQENNFAKGTLTLGDDKRITLDANRVINEKLKIRGNAMLQDSDVAGRDELYDKRRGVSIVADYQPTDKLKVLADYYHLEGEKMPDRGHPWDRATGAPAKVDRDNFYGIAWRDFQDTSADIFTTTFEFDFNNNTRWTTKIRTGKTTNDYIVSKPGISYKKDSKGNDIITDLTDKSSVTIGSRSANSAGYVNKFQGINSQLTYEKHFGNTEHTIVAGAEFSKEKVRNRGYLLDSDVNVDMNILNPDNNVAAPGIVGRAGNTSLVHAEVKSLYLMDTIKFGEKWQVFGGLRYDQFDISRVAPPNNYAPRTKASNSTKFTNGHFGVVYKPRPNGSIYASASSSSNLPGEMFDAGAVAYGGIDPKSAALNKPEKNKTLEIGTKWNLRGDDLTFGAAIFQTDKENKIEATGRNDTYKVHQVGAVQVRGVEVNASGNVTPKLSMTGGAVYMESEVTKSIEPTNVGLEFANVAHKSAYVQTKYQATPKLAVGGAITYKDKIKGGLFAATTNNEIPSSTSLDLMAQYRITKKLVAQVNVNNALDKTIYDALYRSGAPFTYVAPGRSANVTLSYDF